MLALEKFHSRTLFVCNNETTLGVLVVYIEIKIKVTKCVPMWVNESNETSACNKYITIYIAAELKSQPSK